VGAAPVDLTRGHVWARERLAEDAIEVIQLLVEFVYVLVDLGALAEDVVPGAAVAVLVELDILSTCAVLVPLAECESEKRTGSIWPLVAIPRAYVAVARVLLVQLVANGLIASVVVAELFSHGGQSKQLM
jgi:hypothetical protein